MERLNKAVTDIEVLKNRTKVSENRIKDVEGEIKDIHYELKGIARFQTKIATIHSVLMIAAPLTIQLLLG